MYGSLLILLNPSPVERGEENFIWNRASGIKDYSWRNILMELGLKECNLKAFFKSLKYK